MTETSIQSRILRALGSRPDTRLFRNQVGVGWVGKPDRLTRVSFGLHPGSSDLIGWRTITITPEMVGKRVAVFLGIEVKTDSGRLRPNQINWDQRLREAGGASVIVRGSHHPDTIDQIVRSQLP